MKSLDVKPLNLSEMLLENPVNPSRIRYKSTTCCKQRPAARV